MKADIADNSKLIAVIGPTASGKTSLAIKIAKKFNGELINADSRQIYRHLNIGTAKGNVKKIRNTKLEAPNKSEAQNPKWEIEGVPIHLVNIIEPDETLTLAQYQKLAYEVIKDIIRRGKLPVLVGGTGLYVDAVVKGYKIPKVKPNKGLRKKLSNKTVKQLISEIKQIDPEKFESLNESDRKNPHRLIRAIEIAFSRQPVKKRKDRKQLKLEVLFLRSDVSREDLYKRINDRVKIALEEGLLDEVKDLIKKGYKFDTPSFTAIAYPLAKKYSEKKINKETFVEMWQQAERNYARRQETWFKRYQAVRIKIPVEAFEVVNNWLGDR